MAREQADGLSSNFDRPLARVIPGGDGYFSCKKSEEVHSIRGICTFQLHESKYSHVNFFRVTNLPKLGAGSTYL